MKYDIFISYRREGGKEFARSIKYELESKGYSVFLDFDELTDGVFDERILEAIKEAPVFLFILSQHSLDRCVNEDDWVRREIEYAYSLDKHIIPINKDGEFEGLPDNLPADLVEVFGRNQYSEIMVGQLFEASMKKMIKDRIAPVIRRPAGRMAGRIMMTVAAVAVVVVMVWLVIQNSKAGADVAHYEMLLDKAETVMLQEDSIMVADSCLKEANALSEKYEDTKFSDRFSDRGVRLESRLEHARDSFFVRNKNYAEFYMNKYMEGGDIEDKQNALHYLDKALALKNDVDLSSMRRILK